MTDSVPAGAPTLDSIAAALVLLAEASKAQSASMLELAKSTAESMRLAAGTYVFQLRDRFDELLPVVHVGASQSSWDIAPFSDSDSAMSEEMAEEWTALRELPDAFAHVVFHPGDTATASVRIAVSQASVRRNITVRWAIVPEGCTASDFIFAAALLHTHTNGTAHLDNDVSLFVEAPLTVPAGDLPLGQFLRSGQLIVECTDTRPEGVIAISTIDIELGALVVADDDGVGLDLATISCTVNPERRTYWLEKAEGLPLQLPRL
jgi:hypothetical protein